MQLKPLNEWHIDTNRARPCTLHQVLGTDMKKHFDITSRFQVRSLPANPLHAQLV